MAYTIRSHSLRHDEEEQQNYQDPVWGYLDVDDTMFYPLSVSDPYCADVQKFFDSKSIVIEHMPHQRTAYVRMALPPQQRKGPFCVVGMHYSEAGAPYLVVGLSGKRSSDFEEESEIPYLLTVHKLLKRWYPSLSGPFMHPNSWRSYAFDPRDSQ